MYPVTFKKYLFKNKLNNFFLKNNKTRQQIFKRFSLNNKFYFKKKIIYWNLFKKLYIIFNFSINFINFQKEFSVFSRKLISFKYRAYLEKIRYKNYKFKVKWVPYYEKFFIVKQVASLNYLYLYNIFLNYSYIDIFYFYKKFKTKRQRMLHYLFFSFRKNKLFINLQNFKKKNYLTLSSGLFIKFFEKKKSFKKNKTIKLLMAKYVRKIFLISRIKNIILIIKKNPIHLLEIVNFLNLPIIHKFIDPVEDRIIDENENNYLWTKILYFIFLESKNYSKNKTQKKGRIKRKILRKIIFENKIID